MTQDREREIRERLAGAVHRIGWEPFRLEEDETEHLLTLLDQERERRESAERVVDGYRDLLNAPIKGGIRELREALATHRAKFGEEV